LNFIDWIVRIAKTIVKGREAGLWSEKKGGGSLDLNAPSKPEDLKGIKP